MFGAKLCTEDEKETEQGKPSVKDDLNAEESSSSSEEDAELTKEGKKLKEILDRDAGGRDSYDEDEDDDDEEDPDANPDIRGPSALFLQGKYRARGRGKLNCVTGSSNGRIPLKYLGSPKRGKTEIKRERKKERIDRQIRKIR